MTFKMMQKLKYFSGPQWWWWWSSGERSSPFVFNSDNPSSNPAKNNLYSCSIRCYLKKQEENHKQKETRVWQVEEMKKIFNFKQPSFPFRNFR